jgi:hypothetical protein
MDARPLATLLLAAALISQTVAAPDPPPTTSPSKNTPLDGEKLPPGQMLGRLVSTPGSDGSFTLQLGYSHLELKDPKSANRISNQLNGQLQQIAKLQADIARSKKPAPLIQKLQGLVANVQREQQKAQQNLFKVVTDYKDVDLHAVSDVVVRYLQPPVVYNDKGEMKKYTTAELKEMKGDDPKAEGYEAKSSDLLVGQIVKVTLKVHKDPDAGATAGSSAANKPTAEKPAADEPKKDKPKPAEMKTEVVKIVIVVAKDTTPPADAKKK